MEKCQRELSMGAVVPIRAPPMNASVHASVRIRANAWSAGASVASAACPYTSHSRMDSCARRRVPLTDSCSAVSATCTAVAPTRVTTISVSAPAIKPRPTPAVRHRRPKRRLLNVIPRRVGAWSFDAKIGGAASGRSTCHRLVVRSVPNTRSRLWVSTLGAVTPSYATTTNVVVSVSVVIAMKTFAHTAERRSTSLSRWTVNVINTGCVFKHPVSRANIASNSRVAAGSDALTGRTV